MSIIREAGLADLKKLEDILPLAMAESPIYRGKTPEPNMFRYMLLSDPRWACWIGEEGERITGVLIAQVQRGLFFYENIAMTVLYYVTPDKRGTTLPYRLLLEFHQWARKNNVSQTHVSIAGGTRIDAGYRMLRKLGYNLAGYSTVRELQ